MTKRLEPQCRDYFSYRISWGAGPSFTQQFWEDNLKYWFLHYYFKNMIQEDIR